MLKTKHELWLADSTKAAKLNKLINDPIFKEAAEIILLNTYAQKVVPNVNGNDATYYFGMDSGLNAFHKNLTALANIDNKKPKQVNPTYV